MKKVKGLRSTNWWLQNSYRGVKYSIGNRVAKEHIRMTHRHGQQCGDCLRERGWSGWRGAKGKQTTVIA